MLSEFNFARCSRRCQVADRNLQPGESFYSVIVDNKDTLTRTDISAEKWQGPPENAVAWWRSRMPDAGARKMRPAPDSVLLETLSQLVERPDSEALAYMLALLLVRRRVLTEDETFGSVVTDEPSDVWHLQHPVDGRQWEHSHGSANFRSCRRHSTRAYSFTIH